MIYVLPSYNMPSVNGNYMNSGSRYASQVDTVQEYIFVPSTREEEVYPPIGQLVPIGDGLLWMVLLAFIYYRIKQL